ncbi:MAG TPA: type II toxin-antitoxin system RelE/ParE family toxin [Azospirillum sp.]|nr:type II toxin-antitoxin system RelE/ParE family toxin [Azospirillum sp.]
MIKTFTDKRTAALFFGRAVKGIPADVAQRAQRKLAIIEQASVLNDLRVPPGNQLEALSGDRFGQHSIRVNKQWRICFVWREGDAYDVEFCDYH